MLKCEVLRGMPSKIKKEVQRILDENNLSIDQVKFSTSQFREDLLLTMIYEVEEEE